MSRLFALALILCVSASAWADAAFSLSGRISIRHDEEAYHGALIWRHTAARDDLILTGPFGQGAGELHRDAHGAVLLTNDGKRYEAENMQVLADRLFGVRIPIAMLPDWIRGVAPDAYLDDAGRPQRLVLPDFSWTVEWLRYDDAGHPVLISVESEKVGVRLRIDDWHEGAANEAPSQGEPEMPLSPAAPLGPNTRNTSEAPHANESGALNAPSAPEANSAEASP